MEWALYGAETGYYASGRARIGRGGDFLTNVSVGPLFGKLLARQFTEMWERLGAPRRFTIVEQGAGSGDFAADAIEGLRDLAPACFECARYVILEPLEVMRKRQRERLAEFSQIEWVKSVEELEPFEGVHFSNELVDAFPVHRVRWTGREWLEQYVDRRDGVFVFVDGPVEQPGLRERLASIPMPLPDNYQTEVNLAAADWIAGVSRKLRRGWVLTIDYGYTRSEYYSPARMDGTLSGYASHRRAPNPLETPGEIDLTAHVEFTSLAEAGGEHGMKVCGFTDQHRFMVGLSRLHFKEGEPATPDQQRELREFKMLMHPNAMGGSFKALCLEKGLPASGGEALAGFVFGGEGRDRLIR